MRDIEHYTSRIPPQHRKPKYSKWLTTGLKLITDAEEVIESIPEAFDLDNAKGKQQNIIGEIVGLDRLLNFQPQNGRSAYLDDAMYDVLIKAKIGRNHWDGTISGMYKLWENLFPDYKIRIKDNQDMTMTVYILGNTEPFIRELAAYGYIIPKPEGVRINYEFTYADDLDMTIYPGIFSEAQTNYFLDNSIQLNYSAVFKLYGSSVLTDDKEYCISNIINENYDESSNNHLGVVISTYKECDNKYIEEAF